MLAKYTSRALVIALIVGSNPIAPTNALITIGSSTSYLTISCKPPSPLVIFIFGNCSFISITSEYLIPQTISGENSLMISRALVILLPKLNAAKRYSLLFFIKSKVCVPIEPVAPNKIIFFIL